MTEDFASIEVRARQAIGKSPKMECEEVRRVRPDDMKVALHVIDSLLYRLKRQRRLMPWMIGLSVAAGVGIGYWLGWATR